MTIRLSTRLVLLTRTSAYKIPLSRRGYLQGVNEGKMWGKYAHTGLLARLRWQLLGVVCQDRIPQAAKSLNRALFEQQVAEAKRLIPEFQFDNCDLYNIDNWALLNDKYILLDYGVNERISKMY